MVIFCIVCILIVLLLLLPGVSDEIIIQFGYHAYKASLHFATIFTIGVIEYTVVSKYIKMRKKSKSLTKTVNKNLTKTVNKQRVFSDALATWWGSERDVLTRIVEQVEKIKEYQMRIKLLIDANQSRSLQNVVSALEEAESDIRRNIKSVDNYATILRPNSDASKFHDICENIAYKNSEILRQAKELIILCADYVSDDSEVVTLDQMEACKDALLKTLNQYKED